MLIFLFIHYTFCTAKEIGRNINPIVGTIIVRIIIISHDNNTASWFIATDGTNTFRGHNQSHPIQFLKPLAWPGQR